ncbi:MAG: phenylalanine--tRNA ligase subunit beta [Candidatus Methanoperedens sp.]|nr:phenylalanine--tRNA ligase subunit beta [Candidatus Methanoperedens sp.]MCZ7403543.1 phenylalanine--tRNA ligase subunit beta [Candidatus Methanoperedens sp.]
MPVITVYYDDLEELSGIDKETVIKRIPMMGCDIERIEDDHIDVEFFPNRPDLYSTEGVARALKGFLGLETGIREFKVAPPVIKITKDKEIGKIRPFLACTVIRGMQFNSRSIESLMALQESLHWAVGRNRRKVSIGVHDLARIKPPFKYIAQRPDFKFTPLDFTEPMTMREILEKHPKGIKFANILDKFDKYPLILDAEENVLSFPPIINGELTRVTEETTDLFIEVTGLDQSVSVALNIVAASLAERGGRIESVTIDEQAQTPKLEPAIMNLENKEVRELLGFDLTDEEIISCLQKMRYGARTSGNTIEVSVPAYRSDILHNWDLIEDIGIGYGFDKIKPELPSTSTTGKSHPISKLRDSLNEIMTGLGYFEVMPFTLTSEKVQFDMMRREKDEGITHILYPISEDHTIVRTTILPNLLEILSINKHRELPQRIFEAGEVVLDCRTQQKLGAAAIHPQANFTEIQAVVDAVLRERRIEYEVAESKDPAFIEGRRADIIIKGKIAGVFGEIHPGVISNFGLEHPIIGFELRL